MGASIEVEAKKRKAYQAYGEIEKIRERMMGIN
jgi:hypothetical protein